MNRIDPANTKTLLAEAEKREDWNDLAAGVGGAGVMILGLLTPFLREARSHWGLDPELAARPHPTDALVPEPQWGWTHGIEIDAPRTAVWPWIAQIGADRAGFYSYQWLENLAGCQVHNAETIHPEWELRAGDQLMLHPGMPPFPIAECERGRYFVAFAPADAAARERGEPWATVSWLFLLEELGEGPDPQRCRLISRHRVSCSSDLASRLSLGPTLLEPISFAMDRRMLLGIKERAERQLAEVAEMAATF